MAAALPVVHDLNVYIHEVDDGLAARTPWTVSSR
jgi:hypothetical protein